MDKKISQLTGATTPLTGTEELAIVQGGSTVKATAQDVADLAGAYTYEIGEYVPSEGGVIADRYFSATAGGPPATGSFQNYLVVDKDILSTTAPWGLFGTFLSTLSWYDGEANTTAIMVAGALATDAAGLCVNSTNGGKSDWYLPAPMEYLTALLNSLKIDKGLIAAGGQPLRNLSGTSFLTIWTSKDSSANNVYGIDWALSSPISPNLNTGNSAKSTSQITRAVRKFTI